MGSRSDRDEVTRRVGNNHHHFAMACIKNGNYSCGFDSYDDFWRALTESQGLAGADLSRLRRLITLYCVIGCARIFCAAVPTGHLH